MTPRPCSPRSASAVAAGRDRRGCRLLAAQRTIRRSQSTGRATRSRYRPRIGPRPDAAAELGAPAGGRWEAPVDVALLSTASHAGFADPRLAVDARGNTVAVWTNVTGNDWGNQGVVQSAARPAGGGWEPAVDVSTAGDKSFAAHVALDARGNAVVVFNDHTDGRARSAIRPAGGAWTEPVDISEDEAAYPQVGVDADGDAVAVWINSERRLCAARADVRALGPWRSRDCIAVDDEVRTMKAAIEGNAAAVWMTGEGGDSVKAALLPAADDWHAPITISPPQPVGEATGAEAAITMDQRGTAIAIWGREIPAGDDHDTVVQAAVHGPPEALIRSNNAAPTACQPSQAPRSGTR